MDSLHFTSIAQNINLAAMGGNDLSKSNIAEAFMYGSDKLKITKTGKEIKAALEPKCAVFKEKAQSCLTKANAYKAQIPKEIVPTESVPSYWTRGYDDKIPTDLKRYSWDSCKQCGIEAADNSMAIVSNSDEYEKAEASLCSKYNEEVRKYYEYMVECCLIETITNGLDDKSVNELSVTQAAALGF